jgi:dTDP-glucose 4,6-dehydratase
MARLLVTGGAGFIGANFVHYWVARHPQDRLVVLDALTYAGNLDNIRALVDANKARFVRGDICDKAGCEALLKDEKIDTVVHFAAESHVDRSIVGPDAFIETNVVGTHRLLQACRAAWPDAGRGGPYRFHHVSTDEVYGTLSPTDPAFREDTPYAPNSPYAASKASSDHLVRAAHHTYGMPVTTSNCSNNYGPWQFPEKLIPLIIVNILEGKPLPIYGDGKQVRDWLHVEDHCAGIEAVLTKGELGDTYNVGGENEQANIDVVRMLCGLLDERFAKNVELRQRFPKSPAGGDKKAESLITYVKDRPGHDRRYAIDAKKIARELGFRPKHRFEEAMGSTVDWYLSQEPWWRAIQSGAYRDWVKSHYGQ